MTTILLVAFTIACLALVTFLPEAFELAMMEDAIAQIEASEGWVVHTDGVTVARFSSREPARRFRNAIDAAFYTSISKASEACATPAVFDTDAWFQLEMPSPRKARCVVASAPVVTVANDNEGWTIAPTSKVVPFRANVSTKVIDLSTMVDQLAA